MFGYDRFAIITREAFADFLDRCAGNKTDTSEWDHFVTRHYGDSFLEEIRRCVVRLMNNHLPASAESDAKREMLKAWASLLRLSTGALAEQKPDIVTIDLTPAEAVVLDSILRRFSESDILSTESPAEKQCLWDVQCVLEKHGDRPDWPSLEEAARELTFEES